MVRRRSVVYAVEGESRRPGIHLNRVTGLRHRRHRDETVLQRAFGHAAGRGSQGLPFYADQP